MKRCSAVSKRNFYSRKDSRRNGCAIQIDQLENYCIAYGIKGDRWTSKDPFVYRRYASLDEDFAKTDKEIETENMLNELKGWIVPPIHRLTEALEKS
jgi:ATP-dependent helicase/nuclease subunit B